MQDNSFDENPMDINNNPGNQEKEILIDSQEELVKYLNLLTCGGFTNECQNSNKPDSFYRYFIRDDDQQRAAWVNLFDMLCDGVIAPNAITNLDEILQYKDAIEDFGNLHEFLFWFYEHDLGQSTICCIHVYKNGKGVILAPRELKKAVSAFDTEQLKQNPTKYIINLAKQKDSLKKEDYTPENPLENYLLEGSIYDINDLQNLLDEGEQIPWSKLFPALLSKPINKLDDLNKVAKFNENDKINKEQIWLFYSKSVGNWQELFEICDDGAKHDFIFCESDFGAFKDGAFKGFNLNDTQTLEEYGLIKQSRFKYPLYVLWDIGRILVWAITFGKCCKYEYSGDDWFEKTTALYKENSDIEEAIKRIKENQEKAPVSEKPEEVETEEDKNQNNLELTDKLNGFKPKTYANKSQGQDISDNQYEEENLK